MKQQLSAILYKFFTPCYMWKNWLDPSVLTVDLHLKLARATELSTKEVWARQKLWHLCPVKRCKSAPEDPRLGVFRHAWYVFHCHPRVYSLSWLEPVAAPGKVISEPYLQVCLFACLLESLIFLAFSFLWFPSSKNNLQRFLGRVQFQMKSGLQLLIWC